MIRFASRVLVVALLLALLPTASFAAGGGSSGSTNAATVTSTTAAPPASATAASPAALPVDPLLNLLVTKGLLTPAEANNLAGAAMPEVRKNILLLLRDKGILSNEDLSALNVTAVNAATAAQPVIEQATAQAPAKPAAPAVIAAVAPLRVLQVDPPKREGLIPDIKIGPVRVKPYGFFKVSAVYDSSSPYGNDFPLPGFIGITGPGGVASSNAGPDKSPEFHLKARGTRFGSNFEWLDPSKRVTVTGKIEFDFEGNFSRVSNRNISSVRSSMPSIRLAYGRVDYAATDKLTLLAVFGQDWTPFGSSTLPNLFESTGLGIGFGSLYTRVPQIRGGFNYKTGAARNLTFQPEFAVTLPAFGNLPSKVDDQLGFGERQGVDSAQPGLEARLVTQWQLDKAKAVAPAQFIISGQRQRRSAIFRSSEIPLYAGPGVGTIVPANIFQTTFPTGTRVESISDGYTLELQLPTRWVTLTSKYYRGADLRFFFEGQIYSTFNDVGGLTPTPTGAVGGTPAFTAVSSIDGSSSTLFGFNGTTAVIAPQQPIRAQGGFVNLGFPLSRIFNADAAGRNAGWTFYAHYGFDEAYTRDARRAVLTATGAANNNGRGRGDLFSAQMQYKMNPFVTFAWEQSLYRTRTLTSVGSLFAGKLTREQNNVRSEIGTIFTF